MRLLVNNENIDIPLKLSYQVYDRLKIIDGKIIIRSYLRVAIDKYAEYFFTVIEAVNDKKYGCTYYHTRKNF
jgi:hypothetical protein